jgi:hypothetical protein
MTPSISPIYYLSVFSSSKNKKSSSNASRLMSHIDCRLKRCARSQHHSKIGENAVPKIGLLLFPALTPEIYEKECKQPSVNTHLIKYIRKRTGYQTRIKDSDTTASRWKWHGC